MATPQSGILAPIPLHACYLSFNRKMQASSEGVARVLASLASEVDGNELVIGLGCPLIEFLGAEVDGLRPFTALSGCGLSVPSTQHDLWLWLRRGDPGELFHRAAGLIELVAQGFELTHRVEGFRFTEFRDLTGYIDGTENPVGGDAMSAAVVESGGEGLLGSSFVAVQQWQHDFEAFNQLGQPHKDHVIGRRLSDNEELDDAPKSAHVKRTAQESFDPEAFVLRRSMPWRDGDRGGLHFVAFGHSFEAYEAQMRRMIGLDDGIVDGLFQISRPLTGEYYWCPPMSAGLLDLSLVGIGVHRNAQP